MSDGPIINGDATSAAPPADHAERAAPLEAMEYRLRRLEDAVAILQDTQSMEERVFERVRHKLELRTATPPRDAAHLALDAGLRLLPVLPRPAEAPVAPQATIISPAVAAIAAPIVATAMPAASGAWNHSWLLFDTINDLRAMVRVYTDPRYRVTHLGWLVPILVLVFILCSNLTILQFLFLWNWIPVLGPFIDKLVDLLVAFLGFKVLMREVTRYRELVPDAPGRK